MTHKKTKGFKLSLETIEQIKTITELIAIPECQLIELLVRDYAVRLGIEIGEESAVLSAHVSSDGIRQKKEKDSIPSMSAINTHFEHIKTMLAFITSSIKETEANTYTNKDALNSLLLFLKPETDIPELPSTDTKLSITNRRNLHPYISKSEDNYKERIRTTQVSKANIL